MDDPRTLLVEIVKILDKLQIRWYQKGGGERHLEDAGSVINTIGKELDRTYLEQEVEQQSLIESYRLLFPQ